MADNSKKVSELATAANVAVTDRVMVLRSPSSAASVRTVPFGAFCANIVISNTIPATPSSNGIAGNISYNSDYLYFCTANNNWKRIAFETW